MDIFLKLRPLYRVGIVSDVVKTMTWTLGLPTLSTSFGEEGEIREWRDLTPEQENYLVQIRPPADVATGVIRQLISRQNITNAAILFDKNFGTLNYVAHKYISYKISN